MTREEMDAFCDKCPKRDIKVTCNRSENCNACKSQYDCIPHCIRDEMYDDKGRLKNAYKQR
jgi:hypothetical protein